MYDVIVTQDTIQRLESAVMRLRLALERADRPLDVDAMEELELRARVVADLADAMASIGRKMDVPAEGYRHCPKCGKGSGPEGPSCACLPYEKV